MAFMPTGRVGFFVNGWSRSRSEMPISRDTPQTGPPFFFSDKHSTVEIQSTWMKTSCFSSHLGALRLFGCAFNARWLNQKARISSSRNREYEQKVKLKNPSQPGRTMLNQNNKKSFHRSRRTNTISKRFNAKIQSGCLISHSWLCNLNFPILAKVFSFVCEGVPILMFWLLAAAMFDGVTRRKLPGSFGRRLLLVISF
jgi:hypothetical protein